MATKTKKVVEKTPTIAQLNKMIDEGQSNYVSLMEKHVSLKNSFQMIKSNYEREKNRLDKVIDSLLNHSKTN